MVGFRQQFESMVPDVKVVSRWIDLKEEAGGFLTAPHDHVRYAQADLEDIDECDVLVGFTASYLGNAGPGRGGRHVEWGYALARGKRLVLIGAREHIFHTLPQVAVYDWFTDFIRAES
jgi:hypothetical protein